MQVTTKALTHRYDRKATDVLKSPTSRWAAGAAALCAALLALTWIALVGPKRAEAADLTEQAASTRQSNDAMQIRTSQLKAQFATLPQAQAELGTLATKLPPTADVPHFVRSLDALAARRRRPDRRGHAGPRRVPRRQARRSGHQRDHAGPVRRRQRLPRGHRGPA